jgi:hypothetical protein
MGSGHERDQISFCCSQAGPIEIGQPVLMVVDGLYDGPISDIIQFAQLLGIDFSTLGE